LSWSGARHVQRELKPWVSNGRSKVGAGPRRKHWYAATGTRLQGCPITDPRKRF